MPRFMTYRRIRRIASCALPLFGIVACDSPSDPDPSLPPAHVPVAYVEIVQPAGELTVGQTFSLSAQPKAASGAVLDRAISWTSSDTAVATVSAGGVLTARAAGLVRITATAEERKAMTTVTVRAPEPARLAELLPKSVQAGAPAMELRITGTGFREGAVAWWAGQERAVRVISATEVRIDLSADDVLHPGAAEVRVLNPGQTLGDRLYFIIEQIPATTVYQLQGAAWLEGGLPVETGNFFIGGDLTRGAVQRVTSGVLRIHDRPYGPRQWDMTLNMVTVLRSTGEVVRDENVVFFGNVEYNSPSGNMSLRSGLFYDTVLHTAVDVHGDLIVWQTLHPSGDRMHEGAWRYRRQ